MKPLGPLVATVVIAGSIAVSLSACSANPAPPRTLTDYEVAATALQEGGYHNIHQSASGLPVASAGTNCQMSAELDPTVASPTNVTGTLLGPLGQPHRFDGRHLPQYEEVTTSQVFSDFGCAG